MQNVQIEMKNIKWLQAVAIPDCDLETPPTELLFEMTFFDGDCETAEAIDEALADHLENRFGFRPAKWDLWMFDDTCENVCA